MKISYGRRKKENIFLDWCLLGEKFTRISKLENDLRSLQINFSVSSFSPNLSRNRTKKLGLNISRFSLGNRGGSNFFFLYSSK